jgi:uncharacterized protein YndB with AHSA1/START domain
MRWTELEIVVPAPPEEAFPWVVEPGLLREWLPQLEELRPRGFLHHRPIVRHGGVPLTLDIRVARVVVPELVELDVAWRGAIGHSTLEVEPHDDGATVTWRVGLTLPPALRIAGPGVARELRRIMRRNLELLAERLGEPHPEIEVHPGDDASADDAAAAPAAGPGDAAAPGTDGPGNAEDEDLDGVAARGRV